MFFELCLNGGGWCDGFPEDRIRMFVEWNEGVCLYVLLQKDVKPRVWKTHTHTRARVWMLVRAVCLDNDVTCYLGCCNTGSLFYVTVIGLKFMFAIPVGVLIQGSFSKKWPFTTNFLLIWYLFQSYQVSAFMKPSSGCSYPRTQWAPHNQRGGPSPLHVQNLLYDIK
jgi:hypothetical protein